MIVFKITFVSLICLLFNDVKCNLRAFYPSTFTESSCANDNSWTMWFDENHNNSTESDFENMTTILDRYPTHMCRIPSAIQAESTNYESGSCSVRWSWTQPDSSLYLLSFSSLACPNVNFRVRYCCPTSSFVGTTTTTTTPMPIESPTCGIRPVPAKKLAIGKIFGGTDAVANSWPWMAYYQESKACSTGTCYGVCGSTIINNNFVLTAAHCLSTQNSPKITLIAGMHNRRARNESSTRQTRSVSQVYVHPEYNDKSLVHDIALLRVSEPFTFNEFVQPACLPGPEPQPNDTVTIIGWGAQVLGGQVNDVLKQASTTIIDRCKRFWSIVDDSRQICIANSEGGDSACQGDSGGPILSQHNKQYVVSGVASFVRTCNTVAKDSAPNVYTRVSTYRQWIKSITG